MITIEKLSLAALIYCATILPMGCLIGRYLRGPKEETAKPDPPMTS